MEWGAEEFYPEGDLFINFSPSEGPSFSEIICPELYTS